MNDRIFITTTIPFVNARPHVGFALELVQADALARYHRLRGHAVRLQTGTDENALKNVLAARKQGLQPRELVDRNAAAFRELARALNVSADDFVRTTEGRHRAAVHALWGRLRPDDLYTRAYRGLYCVGCEEFLLEKDLVEGVCPDHGTPPVAVAESNWFFRLSAYQAQVAGLLESGRLRVLPEQRRNEVLSFVRAGLQDISVSRDAGRAEGWGIPVPGDDSQTIYVWIDALVNYLTGPGFGAGDAWQEWWGPDCRTIHAIGKNVWKFHAVTWPALLLSAGLPLPDEILIHGFLTENGRKISKSLGNTVDPLECIRALGVDGVRHYLLRGVAPFEDGDFSLERVRLLYNTDLANGLGNLVSRLTTLCERAGHREHAHDGVPEAPPGFHEALEQYAFDEALGALWAVVDSLNREIEQSAPWALLKEAKRAPVSELLGRWLDRVHQVGYWLQPFLPDGARKVLDALDANPFTASGALFARLGERDLPSLPCHR